MGVLQNEELASRGYTERKTWTVRAYIAHTDTTPLRALGSSTYELDIEARHIVLACASEHISFLLLPCNGLDLLDHSLVLRAWTSHVRKCVPHALGRWRARGLAIGPHRPELPTVQQGCNQSSLQR